MRLPRTKNNGERRRVVLIACASKKLSHGTRAKDLYDSTLFRLSYQYALAMRPDAIFILSAKHGLLDPDREIMPYNQTLNKMPVSEVRAWADQVLHDLRRQADLENDQFIFLAGQNYRRFLIPHLRHYEIPMIGLPIGKQLQFLKRALQT